MAHSIKLFHEVDEEDEYGDTYKMTVKFHGVYGGEYGMMFNTDFTAKQFASSLRQFADSVERGIRHEWH